MFLLSEGRPLDIYLLQNWLLPIITSVSKPEIVFHKLHKRLESEVHHLSFLDFSLWFCSNLSSLEPMPAPGPWLWPSFSLQKLLLAWSVTPRDVGGDSAGGQEGVTGWTHRKADLVMESIARWCGRCIWGQRERSQVVPPRAHQFLLLIKANLLPSAIQNNNWLSTKVLTS